MLSATAAPETRPRAHVAPHGGLARWIRRLLATWRDSYQRLVATLQIPEPEPAEWMRRIAIMERNIILPTKIVGIAALLYFFIHRNWLESIANALDVEFQETHHAFWGYAAFLWAYVAANLVIAVLLASMRHLRLGLVQWSVFATCLMDGIFLSLLVLATGGYNSILYYLFLALTVRSAMSVPRATSQIALNLTLSACFMFAGFVDVLVSKNLDEESRKTLMLSAEYPPEPVVLRLSLLLLMTVCCYGVQILMERQRRVEAVAREVAAREGAVRSAGRLAAEFAHQLKNPLAIINTAAYSLQRAIKEGKSPASAVEQVEMIKEEVERADRIITEVVGYAQLNEGHVEELSVQDQLDLAVTRVFPPAAHYPIQVHRRYRGTYPPLLMQQRHAHETFLNVLQNAREALEQKGGNIWIEARCREDQAIEVLIRDDGPGIRPQLMERIFEAYYTTKEKGSGLGLATVKHNVELYGGRIRVESTLGKGACFTLLFPSKTLTTMPKPS